MALYAAEARKQGGGRYPLKTIYSLLTGVLRHMRSINANCPNFLDFNNVEFAPLENPLDNLFRDLRVMGIGAESKSAEVFTKEEEDQLWSSDTLPTKTPKGLLHAVFFLNRKNFCLRGGEEHRQLKLSQLKRVASPPKYIYTECATGGLAQMRLKNKTIDAVEQAGNQCHVYVLDLYMEKIPKEAFERDNFYLQPVSKIRILRNHVLLLSLLGEIVGLQW